MAQPASSPTGTPSSVIGVSHPLYQRWRDIWTTLLDVFEGAGGFLDESKPYLIAHPREWLDHSTPIYDANGNLLRFEVNRTPSQPSPKLVERRKLARYENIAATLIEQLMGLLFRVKPERSFGAEKPGGVTPMTAFWQDADGLGTSWDDLLKEAWGPCAAFGHLWGYVDVDPEDSRKAVVRWYTPIDVPDWLVDERGRLISVKFLEAAPRETYKKLVTASSVDIRVREVTAEGWRLTHRNGKLINEGTHDFGVVPAFVLYAKRRAMTPFIGRSVLGDPQLYIDLYNLISECRELLRKQTFSILNIPIGDAAGGVQREQQLIGQQSGTGNILFTTNSAQMLSPDNANVESYHNHIDRLTRLIYRLAVVAWEADGGPAESAESRKIKRQDLNAILAGYADELQRVDRFVTSLVYRAYYGDAADRWETNDQLTIRYPDTFDTPDLTAIVKQFSDALALDLGPTASGEVRKRAARIILPDTDETVMDAIDADINGTPTQTVNDRRAAALEAMTARLVAAEAEDETSPEDEAEDIAEANGNA